MAITNRHRLDAVLSKLESIENELRQTKRIMQYIYAQSENDTGTERGSLGLSTVRVAGEGGSSDLECMGEVGTDREGLYKGQLDYHITDRPSYIEAEEKADPEDECTT